MLGKDPDDNLKNRRAIAFIAFFYVLIWPFIILAAHMFFDLDIDAATLFLSYGGVFGGSPIVAYFIAAQKDSK
ncbi:MAG: hypothetical protein JKY93_01180 [Gammaproteobacteria bacterium]|nr:hypothetical protein [Gammaproteobacteria bacterium]